MNATFGTERWVGLSALGRRLRLPGAAPQAGIARAVGPEAVRLAGMARAVRENAAPQAVWHVRVFAAIQVGKVLAVFPTAAGRVGNVLVDGRKSAPSAKTP